MEHYYNDPIQLLLEFGLTRLEASVYLGLLTEGDLNGYEAAKKLGISRSNAYTSLAALVDKGAAWTVDGSPVRYTPVPPQEFCSNKLRSMEKTITRLLGNLPTRHEKEGGYITIRGEERVREKLRNLTSQARERVYLALHGEELLPLVPELQALLSQGGKVVIITDPEGTTELKKTKKLQDALVYTGEVRREQIRAIADSHSVLTGDLTGGSNAECLYSDRKNLVDLFKTALKNEIRLIEMVKSTEEPS